MFRSLHILILLVTASFFHGCLYSDDEVYYVEPEADDPPIISVTTNLDTITNPTVVDSLLVLYDIDIQNGDLYFVEAAVANQVVYESDTTQGSFWLYDDHVQLPGIETLYIDIYYSSNTNSLADVVGFEALQINLEYEIDFTWGSR
jgi:hypothetical protein